MRLLFNGLLLLILLYASCQNQADNQANISDSLQKMDSTKTERKTKKVFFTLPSPLESMMMIKKTGVGFSDDFLNSIDKIVNYSTNRQMALNLGIYGADLSYVSLYDQKQTVISYMAAIKKLAMQLGLLNTVKPADIKRMEENIGDKTEIMQIISETFLKNDAYLKENNRTEIAAIVVIGGWVESLYIACELANKSNFQNNELRELIVDQRHSLNNIMAMLESYKEHPDVKELYLQMADLLKLFESLCKESVVAVKDKKTNQTIIKSVGIDCSSKENVKLIFTKLLKIRTSIVNS